MQFPRYELVRLERELALHRARDRPLRPPHRWCRRARPRPVARHRAPERLTVQQYLELEFTVVDRR